MNISREIIPTFRFLYWIPCNLNFPIHGLKKLCIKKLLLKNFKKLKSHGIQIKLKFTCRQSFWIIIRIRCEKNIKIY